MVEAGREIDELVLEVRGRPKQGAIQEFPPDGADQSFDKGMGERDIGDGFCFVDLEPLPGHTYRTNIEAAKKEGIVLDYRVYETTPRSPDEPNVYLTVTYKNMAALDGLDERMEPIMQRSFGDEAARGAAAIDREKMRRQVGQEMIREVVFK